MITSRYDTVEAAQLQALSLHVLHGATEIKYQVVANAVGDLHTPLKRISFRRSEYYVHLLVRKVILQELLIFKTIRCAGNHAHIKCLNEDLHRHNRMWIRAV